ncbi:MAG: rhodanese-like domain-containing protein [Methylococcales bacterium]|nr:rhodanese-like domain-containing protein [Methylococcales bacterium]
MIENLNPKQSVAFMQQNTTAILIDVRTKIEHHFVGHPLSAIHIAWKEAPDWQENPEFMAHVNKLVPKKETPILLLCRSGQRSLAAASALENNGYSHLINIVEGFEGDLDSNKQRGNRGGWRYHDLPWVQS